MGEALVNIDKQTLALGVDDLGRLALSTDMIELFAVIS